MQDGNILTNGFMICTQSGMMQIDLLLTKPSPVTYEDLKTGSVEGIQLKPESQGTVFMSLDVAKVLRDAIDENLKDHAEKLMRLAAQSDKNDKGTSE